MSSLWDCEKCGYNHYEEGVKCVHCRHRQSWAEQGRKDDSVDMVNHPPHYKDRSGIECIEVTRKMQFCGGNCFKCLYRAGQKGSPIEDLEKARWYAVEAHSSSERVSYSAAQDIFKIADSRGREFIAQAMSELARERWARVILFISHEIAYLESLQGE